MSAKKAFFASGAPDAVVTVATAVRRVLWPRASALTIGALGALGSMASGVALAADVPAAPNDVPATASSDTPELSEVVVTVPPLTVLQAVVTHCVRESLIRDEPA